MNNTFSFSSTYLFKIHDLSNSLEKAFDQVLQGHASLTFSQFTLLLAVAEHQVINQRAVAKFLGVSPAAINRQVEIAQRQGLLLIKDNPEGRGQALSLTPDGSATIDRGVTALEQHLFKIFADENRQTSLMGHIDLLLDHTKGVIAEQAQKNDKRANYST